MRSGRGVCLRKWNKQRHSLCNRSFRQQLIRSEITHLYSVLKTLEFFFDFFPTCWAWNEQLGIIEVGNGNPALPQRLQSNSQKIVTERNPEDETNPELWNWFSNYLETMGINEGISLSVFILATKQKSPAIRLRQPLLYTSTLGFKSLYAEPKSCAISLLYKVVILCFQSPTGNITLQNFKKSRMCKIVIPEWGKYWVFYISLKEGVCYMCMKLL